MHNDKKCYSWFEQQPGFLKRKRYDNLRRRIGTIVDHVKCNKLCVDAGDGRTLRVDGAREFGTLPELERLGREEGEHFVVRARRLDSRLWEVEADPL